MCVNPCKIRRWVERQLGRLERQCLVSVNPCKIRRWVESKETAFKKSLEALLVKNGKLLTWREFKPLALQVSGNYNVRWLETEYHQTVGTANMVAKWHDFQANKDLYPNLKYETVGDARVRASHKKWEGVVLPIDHSWWQTHYPPNDWGCRCDAIPTDEEVTKKIPQGEPKPQFKNNPALTGKIFTHSGYENVLSKNEKNSLKITALLRLTLSNNKEIRTRAQKLFFKLPIKDQFKVVLKTKKGNVLEHLLAEHGSDYTRLKTAARELAKQGGDSMILPNIKNVENWKVFYKTFGAKPYRYKNPDLYYNKKFYEHEGYLTKNPKSALNKMFKRGLFQSSHLIIENIPSITRRDILRTIKYRIAGGKIIKEVWVLTDDGVLILIYKKTKAQ